MWVDYLPYIVVVYFVMMVDNIFSYYVTNFNQSITNDGVALLKAPSVKNNMNHTFQEFFWLLNWEWPSSVLVL